MVHPNFARVMRERGLPLEPPRDNPIDTMRISYGALQDYAQQVASVAAEVADDCRTLRAENESLQRENDRLTDELARANRELRASIAFAQSQRTNMSTLRTLLDKIESEALQQAQHAMEDHPQRTETERPERSRHDLLKMAEEPNVARLPDVSWAGGSKTHQRL